MKMHCILLFLSGISCAGAMMMFHQDLLGLEGYISYLRSNWNDLPPWVGALGIAFNVGVAIWWYFEVTEKFKKLSQKTETE